MVLKALPMTGILPRPARRVFSESEEVREDAVPLDAAVKFRAGDVVFAAWVEGSGDCGAGRAMIEAEKERRRRMLCILKTIKRPQVITGDRRMDYQGLRQGHEEDNISKETMIIIAQGTSDD